MNSPAPFKPQFFGLIAGLFLAAALCFASVTFTRTWVHLKESQVVQVTGSAKKNVRSDLVVWNAAIQSEGKTLSEAHRKFQADQAKVAAFLKSKGVAEYSASPVSVRDVKKSAKRSVGDVEDDESAVSQRVGYQLVQAIQVSSADVNGLPRLAADCLSLLADDVVIQTTGIEFHYTKLADTKVAMMAEATDDARRRAEEIAGRGGRKVQGLRTAKMGVVQVNPLHSSATSWDGNNDTSNLEKTITATVSAEFALQ